MNSNTKSLNVYMALVAMVFLVYIYASVTGWQIINPTDTEHSGQKDFHGRSFRTHRFYNHK